MAWYRAGSLSLTNGSAAVVGAGTSWLDNVQAGHAINLPDGRVYEVLSVNSDTQITLGSNYAGPTATGQAYSVQPNAGFAQRAAQLLSAFLSTYQGFVSTVFAGRFSRGSGAAPGVTFVDDLDTGVFSPAEDAFAIATGGQERMRVSALGDHGFGTSSPAARVHAAKAFGALGPYVLKAPLMAEASYTRTDNGDFVARRLLMGASDYSGCIQSTDTAYNITSLAFNPIGGNVSIGTSLSKDPLTVSGNIAHAADNVSTFATPAYRAAGIFLGNAPNITSDARDKRLRDGDGVLTEAELAAARDISAQVRIYQMEDAITLKGEAGARLHIGTTDAIIRSAFAAHGLDWSLYGLIGHDAWEATPGRPSQPAQEARYDEDGELVSPAMPALPAVPPRPAGDRYNVRYEELAMFLMAAQEQRLAEIEGRLA